MDAHLKEEQDKIINTVEKYVRRYVSIIGHNNADDLMELVKLVKKQQIEISRLESIKSYNEFVCDDKNYTDLIYENAELKRFHDTTEEMIGDELYQFIKDRMVERT